MNTTKMILVALLATLVLIGCRKDDDNSNNGNNGNTNGTSYQGDAITSVEGFWQSQRAAKIQKKTITAGTYSRITGAAGTKIDIYSNSLLKNGVAVTGTVDIELIEAYDKADLLSMGLHTMGRDYAWNYAPMVSAGEFYFKASQNGQDLEINPNGPIQITTAAFPDADFNTSMMPLILEADSAVTDSVWVPVDTSMGNCRDSAMVNLGQSAYCFSIANNATWINCDYFYNSGAALTSMTVNLPTGFTSANTQVMLSFDGLNVITNLNQDATGAFVLGTGYRVPIGQATNLIVIGEQNGVLVYHIQAVVIANNQVITIPTTGITGTTTAALQAQLSNLP
jgi:hypothetical protein